MKYLICLLPFILCLSCNKESPAPTPPPQDPFLGKDYPEILRAFDDAATAAGLDVTAQLQAVNITVTDDIFEEGVCAGGETLYIPRNMLSATSQPYIEQLVFHQLGHCVLNREHNDEKLANGEWKSLMRSRPLLSDFGQGIDYRFPKIDYYRKEMMNPEQNTIDNIEPFPIEYDSLNFAEEGITLACDVDYDNSILQGENAEITVSFNLEANPDQLRIELMSYLDLKFTIKYDPSLQALVFRDLDYGILYQTQELPWINGDGKFDLTIQRSDDYTVFYIDQEHVYTNLQMDFHIADVKGYADTEEGCGARVSVRFEEE